MNINKLFKIITIVFVSVAVLTLIFVIAALVSENNDKNKNEEAETRTEAGEKPGKANPAVEDESIGGSSAGKKDSSSDKKNDSSDKKSDDEKNSKTDTDAKSSESGNKNNDKKQESGSSDTGTKSDSTAVDTGGLPIGQSVPVENLKFDGSETHFVLQNIESFVNVRKEASINSEKIGALLKGSYGVVVEEGEEFSRVQCGDITGYIRNNYLMTGRAADERIQGVSTKVVKIDRAVYIRDDAGMDSNKLAIAAEGAVYSVDPTAPEVHGWVAIVYNDAPKAYVSASFCTVE